MSKTNKYDKYKLCDNMWLIPCKECGKRRLVRHSSNRKRALERRCYSCSAKKREAERTNKASFSKAKLHSWGVKIKRRDKKCLVCGSKKNLEAHHIISKAVFKELAYSLNNGITLCNICHKEHHSFNGKTKQFIK